MLTIIFAIVLAVAICYASLRVFARSEPLGGFLGIVALCVLVSGVLLGLGIEAPISGYTDWEFVEETELVALSNSTASGGTGRIYVSLSADSSYTYRYEIDSEFGTETSKEYETRTLLGKNVQEIEDPNCEVPLIQVYQRKGKMSIWTFGLGNTEYKYVFYVPEGTISKEVKLN